MFKDVSDFLYVLNADSGRYADAFVSYTGERALSRGGVWRIGN